METQLAGSTPEAGKAWLEGKNQMGEGVVIYWGGHTEASQGHVVPTGTEEPNSTVCLSQRDTCPLTGGNR